MDMSEKQDIAALINFFWGPSTATALSVNESAAQVAYEALEQANICNSNMDLVPRPGYGALDIKYVVKQLADIGKRIAMGDSATYNVCKTMVSARYRSKITLALMGV